MCVGMGVCASVGGCDGLLGSEDIYVCVYDMSSPICPQPFSSAYTQMLNVCVTCFALLLDHACCKA